MDGYGNDNPDVNSQGMKRVMVGGEGALIGTTLVFHYFLDYFNLGRWQ